MTYIVPLEYHYRFSEKWKTFYDKTENLPLDKTLLVSPNPAGHILPNTFMMNVYVYNQLLNRKTHQFTWKVMNLALLDAIMRQLTAIYTFFVAAIQKPPKLCLSEIKGFRRFCIYTIRQPCHCLGYTVINYYQLITFIAVCRLIFICCEMLVISVSVNLCF